MSRATRPRSVPTLRLAALALAAPLLLVGCSGATADSATEGAAAGSQTTETGEGAESTVTLTDGWAKAGDGMTGVFGTLDNNGDADITLESVESPSAGMIELHETVTSGGSSTMREVDGGFTIPAGGTFELAPGGNHIMFMDMPEALLAGDEVPLTLAFDNGSTLEISVLVKDFSGAQENYEGDESHDSSDGHSHDDDTTEH